MTFFQIICLLFLPLAYWQLQRVDPEFRRLAPPIFVAAWIGEASSIAFYGFYHYSDAWWLRFGGVPLLVALIWPPVIVSGRAVVRALWPKLGGLEPLAVGAIVFFDAAMVEVIAVRCGLWGWAERGYLGVPLIGAAGWAFFAFAVVLIAQHTAGAARWWLVIGAPALLHVLLIGSWWIFFRWFWRGDWFGLFLLVVAALTALAWRRRAARRMSLAVARPRLVAAGLFLLLLLFSAPASGRVWLHVLLTSIPYALVTDFADTPPNR
jgi:hypothetical protein